MAKTKTAKKATAKKAAKKSTAKTGKKKITDIFPDLIPVSELDKEEITSEKIESKTGNKLTKKQIKEYEDKLSICETQRIAYIGTPAEKHYEEKANEFRKLLGRD